MASDNDAPPMSCYNCERDVYRRDIVYDEVPMDLDEGGYEMVPVPVCRDCYREWYGYDCPHCGIPHESASDARYCCERHPSEAPDCPECNRRMELGAWGYDPIEGTTATWAECEACEVGWGAYTGFHDLEESA